MRKAASFAAYCRVMQRSILKADVDNDRASENPEDLPFKTRIKPYRIAIWADYENSDALTENQRRFRCLRTSFVDAKSEVPTMNSDLVKFPEHWPLKTEHTQRRCGLLFPYATRRRSTTGLVEQMPRSKDRHASAGSYRSGPTPTNHQSSARPFVRTREVDAFLVIAYRRSDAGKTSTANSVTIVEMIQATAAYLSDTPIDHLIVHTHTSAASIKYGNANTTIRVVRARQ